MKKILGVIIGIIAIYGLVLNIFGIYNSETILYNQASFEIYLDTSKIDVNEYFKLSRDTFDINKHKIVCQFPVEIQGFKPSNAIVRTNLDSIDCNAKYENGKHIKYDDYELKGTKFNIMVVNKDANMLLVGSPLGNKMVLGSKTLNYKYKTGDINRLIITKNGLIEYCK